MIRRLLIVWIVLCGLLFVQQSKAWWQSIQQVAVASGGGSVTLDAVGTLLQSGTTTSVNYTGQTVGTLSSGGLIALITLGVLTETVTSVVWDSGGANQALTSLSCAVNSPSIIGRIEIWGRIGAIASGNKTMAVTYSGSTSSWVEALSYEGVNQGSLAAAFLNCNTNTAVSTTVAATVTSGSGHAVVSGSGGGSAANASSITGTQIYINNAGSIGVIGARTAGAASVGVTATYDTLDSLFIAGIDVSP